MRVKIGSITGPFTGEESDFWTYAEEVDVKEEFKICERLKLVKGSTYGLFLVLDGVQLFMYNNIKKLRVALQHFEETKKLPNQQKYRAAKFGDGNYIVIDDADLANNMFHESDGSFKYFDEETAKRLADALNKGDKSNER